MTVEALLSALAQHDAENHGQAGQSSVEPSRERDSEDAR